MNQEFLKLTELIGDFIEYWGFRKIHGRVWSLVYLSEQPISTPEIVQSLNVSKAFVSGAINDLLEHGLIKQRGKIVNGAITYESVEDLASVVRNVIKNRELVLLGKIEDQMKELESLKSINKDLNISYQRLVEIRKLTLAHKNLAKKLSSSRVSSVDEWASILKLGVKFF